MMSRDTRICLEVLNTIYKEQNDIKVKLALDQVMLLVLNQCGTEERTAEVHHL